MLKYDSVLIRGKTRAIQVAMIAEAQLFANFPATALVNESLVH